MYGKTNSGEWRIMHVIPVKCTENGFNQMKGLGK